MEAKRNFKKNEGKCNSCKKIIVVSLPRGVKAKYCTQCGAEMNYSDSLKNPSSLKVDDEPHDGQY